MKQRTKRIFFVIIALVAIGLATKLIVKSMQSNLAYLYPPEDVINGKIPDGKLFRLGGLVKPGTLVLSKSKIEAIFWVTDNRGNEVKVISNKILPDLFKEGKSSISRGRLNADGVFIAEEVIAKHDAEYMPKELEDVLKKEHAPAQK